MSSEKTTQIVCECGAALVLEETGSKCSKLNDCVIWGTKNEDPISTTDIKTYTFPEYWNKNNKYDPDELQKTWNQKNTENDGKSFAKKYKKTPMGKNMDKPNKKALDVMATEGMEAAVKHMFTDQESGRQLSYSEMRMRYG